MHKELELEFAKIVGEGKALGRAKGKVVFSYGVLPGETAKVEIVREKRNFIDAKLIEIINPSAERIKEKEDHFISCSPWQIMNYDYQAKTKKNLIEDLLYQTTKENIKIENFHRAEKIFGYRTKIEYSFTANNEEKLCFAFHKRGCWGEKYILENGCALMGEETNAIALKILGILNSKNIALDELKTLVFRESKHLNERVAVLFVKNKDINLGEFQMDGLNGFIIAYSNPLSPMSVATEIIYQSGADFITEELLGKKFSYGYDCFFQNNIDLFEKALEEIKQSSFNCAKIIDLYSGVGTIGLSLSEMADKIYAIESVENAVKYAQINAKQNNISNFEIICSMTEKANTDIFKGTDILVLDPPRAGVHKKVIKAIFEILPKRIIYLSCNPITQGRDAAFFLEKYDIIKTAAFDFYPNTPHAETLLVFNKKT
ncbi:MAG: 23S rRNA (uracil(1939)-C(5))-methyltransferase RlmD [Elusimicrobia bacterium]|nr:23S rRNA (uracil(1939)-C(5))-methyltransferase RlmD [Elusimicrobiota bacterium]